MNTKYKTQLSKIAGLNSEDIFDEALACIEDTLYRENVHLCVKTSLDNDD